MTSNQKRIILVLLLLFLCIAAVKLFLHQQTKTTPTKAASQSTQLANPASVNCAEKGGTLVIQKIGDGSEYGLCQFEDNMACEEWALFRNECPVGGVKTTGYDNEQQMYCAWLGGKTLAEPDAKCTLPSGKVCTNDALFSGQCSND